MFCARAKACAAALAAPMVVSAVAALWGAAAQQPSAEIQAVAASPSSEGAVLQITSSRPVTPQMQIVDQPLRLVIDLPNSKLTTSERRVHFRNAQIKNIRLNQYRTSPAVTRIVVDLLAPVSYSSDESGHEIHIRIQAPPAGLKTNAARPPSRPAFTTGIEPAVTPVTVGNSGTLVEAGNRVASGSAITAGEEVAVLRLARGGEVRVCPGTTLSVTTSGNGQDMMMGMNQGSMETHYVLQSSVDSVLTPDFRIVLPGPGAFHLAVRADRQGNTCVASMPGSTSSAVVAELIGNGTYEIKPQQEVIFRQGRLDSTETPLAACGCPLPGQPVLQAANSSQASVRPAEGKLQLQNSPNSPAVKGEPTLGSGNGLIGQKPADPSHMTVSVESPLVFSGLERSKNRPTVVAAPLPEATSLGSSSRQTAPLPTLVVLPPAAVSTRGHKNLLGRVKGLLDTLFQ
ncbi:MAG: AMIN domain-containing protein [Acidobacteria bacterium]|nr:AMIN domain-containing protein [Acidobacteriota bacterium]